MKTPKAVRGFGRKSLDTPKGQPPGFSRVAALAAALAFLAHTLIIVAGLNPGWRVQPLLASDSSSYIIPAQNLIAHGVFSSNGAPPFLWEPYRTVGYPILIALTLTLTGRPEFVMFFAAASAGWAAWCASRLVHLWHGSVRAQLAAGIMVALLPNSLGLAGQVLTDALSAHLFLVWLYYGLKLYTKYTHGSLLLCVVLMGMLQTVRPTYNLLAVLVLAFGAAWLRQVKQWLLILVLAACSVPVPLFHALFNNRDHGVFAPTFINVATAREYLQAGAISEDTSKDAASIALAEYQKDLQRANMLSEPPSLEGRIYWTRLAAVKQFLQDRPFQVIRLMCGEMLRQFAAPQEFVAQLFFGELPSWARAGGSVLSLLLWLGALLGAVVLCQRRDCLPAFVGSVILVFFLFTGAISSRVGARLRLPADLAAIPIAAIGYATPWRRRAQ